MKVLNLTCIEISIEKARESTLKNKQCLIISSSLFSLINFEIIFQGFCIGSQGRIQESNNPRHRIQQDVQQPQGAHHPQL